MQPMRKARALKPGDAVGLTAPSGAVRDVGGVERAIEAVEALGFRAIADGSCFRRYGYLSGTDEERAAGVNRMFRDDRVDAVFCLRGGYGATRMLDRVDFDLIRQNPKPFLGYSDVTALHAAINGLSGLITLHGPMPATDFPGLEGFSRKSLERMLFDPAPLGEVGNPDGMPLSRLVPGKCEGRLAGGNLSLVAQLIGTPWQIDARGKILLLEDVGEYTYRLDGMLTQLRHAGLFRDCAGVVLGGFTDCRDEYEGFGATVEALVRDIVAPAGKPVLAGFSIGHVDKKITVPLGAMCALDADELRLTILEGALH
ncbi:MAG: LD-carboxypeptidase [Clostridiales bacterium]|jgi:muramoyltetrapeptide carboxypeptidase|nr:LD-carboxypeptidase [Clostridiales bacterium]